MIVRNETDISIMQSNFLFSGMHDAQLEETLSLLKASTREYARGELLHHAGTSMKHFGMVLTGVVQACIDDIEGNRMIMTEVLPGSTFGESLCFLKIPDSPVYIYASEDVRVLWLSAEALYEGSDPFYRDLQRRFTSILAMRNLAMNNRIQVLGKLRLRDRLIMYFSELSAAQGSNTFRLPLNRDDTATYIGANRSALSRELSAMKRDGLIDYDRNTIRILSSK